MKNCKVMAEEWGLSLRTVNHLCKTGKIPGAEKIGGIWQIPDDASRPKDGRVTSGKYRKNKPSYRIEDIVSSVPCLLNRKFYGVFRETPAAYVARNHDMKRKKPLPIGISDYVRAQSEYYYVDKTSMIKEILDQGAQVSLFTRPRRFGKTLNMDMLRVFFEKTQEDTSAFFRERDIWKCGEYYTSKQGKYPVIFLTFKDAKCSTWEMTISHIRSLIQQEYDRHGELENSDKLSEIELQMYRKVRSGKAGRAELETSMRDLSRMLAKHYGQPAVIIIDEYDTPIQEGYSKDFYDEIVGFMRNFFSGACKDNRDLAYAFLTGILRISQESIFSGLNNLAVYTVLDEKFGPFFGFTRKEVSNMLRYYGAEDKESELREWYDGYRFGDQEIYNPWSVINYISNGFVPQPYWVNTSQNGILQRLLSAMGEEGEENLYTLLNGRAVEVSIEQNMLYHSLLEDPENVFGILLSSGYLKVDARELMPDGSWEYCVSIPNKEIMTVYKKEVWSYFRGNGVFTQDTVRRIRNGLKNMDLTGFQSAIGEYIGSVVSFYDTATEGFYHGLVLGLVAMMENQYVIRSNREAGEGRYDISLMPRDARYPGVILEMKQGKRLSDENLLKLACAARKQIDTMQYGKEMCDAGVVQIIKLGVAFSGKKVRIV